MKRVERSSVVERAVEALKQAVFSGEWSGRLPGTRVLAAHLGVSQPTVAAALARLAEIGLLEKGGERRAYEISRASAGGRAKKAQAAMTKRVIILTHQELGKIADSTRAILENLQQKLLGKGWLVELRHVDFLHAKRPHKSWDEIIGVEPGTSVVAAFGRPALAEWAGKKGVRMLFLGGVVGGFPVPMVGVSSASMAEVALRRLVRAGHRWIIMPLCDRPPTYAERVKNAVRTVLEEAGQTYVASYHNPESEYLKPEVTWRMMEAAFKKRPPTAMVFLDWKELVTACCYLWKKGLQVPRDVSLILLNDHVEAGWLVPPVARFEFPANKLVRAMVSWVEGHEIEGGHLTLEADFLEGETIGSAPG